VSLGAVLASSVGPPAGCIERVHVAAIAPELPLVVAGVFHPPIA
jgi:hypothetical protein